MSCYHPWLYGLHPGLSEVDPATGEIIKPIYKPLCQYSPDHPAVELYGDFAVKIPCGKCLGCKLDYSRNWADRMILELDSNAGKGIFVTLTYNNDHVPFASDEDFSDVPNGFSLCKRDLQLFFKRLRKRFSDKTLRYYSCGEYGSQTQRPHYHCIIFGLCLDDFPDRCLIGRNELGHDYYTSDLFQSVWSDDNGPIGYVRLSDVSYKTCAYVSRYCAKKVFAGTEVLPGQQKEFTLMSRRPGIGSSYFEHALKEDSEFMKKKRIFLSDHNGSVQVGMPKFFLHKLKLTDKELYDKLIADRKQFARDRELMKLQGTSLSYIDQLELEEQALFNKTKILFKREEV